MAINLATLRERLSNKFGSGGSRFDTLFVAAANDVSADLNRQCFLDIDDIDNANATIDVDSKYVPAYRDGMAYYLQSGGEIMREPDDSAGGRYRQSLAMCQYMAIDELDLKTGTPEGE